LFRPSKRLLWEARSQEDSFAERLTFGNAPLFLHPEILDEVLKYVQFSKEGIAAYRAHAAAKTK
jgi:hypothetical protein